ncbi:MAG: DUF5518 domain-containing protein [Methanobacterium paludis]|nr:DUF5518 domain-containing protein [Methanobacterium paludis]
MVELKPVIVGLILAIVLGILFGILGGTWGMYFGVLLAGLVVGYMVDKDIKDGLIHGALSGAIGGIIMAIITIILASTIVAIGMTIAFSVILLIIFWVIFAGIGGVIGVMIKGQPTKRAAEEPTERASEEPVPMKSPNIEFKPDNIQKCLCTTCPVQEESECVKEKAKTFKEMMQSEGDMMPHPIDVPGMYCANGKATCEDLDATKMCQCTNCLVWKENDLESAELKGYFCRDGKA